MKRIVAIYCGESNEVEVESIQKHFFREGFEWYSAKYYGENKFKKKINNYLVIEDNNMFESDNNTLDGINDAKIVRFNSPLEFLRHNKIKRITKK